MSDQINSREVVAIVEIPFKSNVKYEIGDDGQVWVDRILSTSMFYPGNYGYIPDTLAGDGDPLDILIINDIPFYPGSRVKCRVLGMLNTSDEKGTDEKIIAVPIASIDPKHKWINELSDLSHTNMDTRIMHFFENYKKLEEGKHVNVLGYSDSEETIKKIEECRVKKTI